MDDKTNRYEAARADDDRRRERARILALQEQVDERDEIIRLLNEALSQALDELNGVRRAA